LGKKAITTGISESHDDGGAGHVMYSNQTGQGGWIRTNKGSVRSMQSVEESWALQARSR